MNIVFWIKFQRSLLLRIMLIVSALVQVLPGDLIGGNELPETIMSPRKLCIASLGHNGLHENG